MENSYWLDKWQKNDIAFHEQDINADLITYIDKLNLNSGDYIFVPLCGKTKDILWLTEKGFHVIGVELSPIACNDFFAELNITPHVEKQSKFTKYQCNNIELLCGDLFNLTSSDLPIIHAVYDCKALIALPSDLRKKYIDHIVKCIGTKIKILLLTRETGCQVKPPPFPISKTEVDLLYGSYFDIQLLKCLSITDIPERLAKKGYTEMTESVYLISGKDTIVRYSCNI
jgi:thiopurine S-methyltransferase